MFVIVLVFVMLRLPFTVRGDETVAGQLQTFLDYSLGATSVLLGLATVFLACATLTSDIKTMTIHLVVAKPVSRFEILVGKWLGINALMLLLVILCGVTIYGFARLIRSRPTEFTRDAVAVRDVLWRARVAATPTRPPELEAAAREWYQSQLKQGQRFATDERFVIAQRVKELEREWRMIPPGHVRIYLFEG